MNWLQTGVQYIILLKWLLFFFHYCTKMFYLYGTIIIIAPYICFNFNLQLHTQCIIDLLKFFFVVAVLVFWFWFIYNNIFLLLYQMIYWLKSENKKIKKHNQFKVDFLLQPNLVLYVVCEFNKLYNNKTFQLVQCMLICISWLQYQPTHVCKYEV